MNFKTLSLIALVLATSLYVVRAEEQYGADNAEEGADHLVNFDHDNAEDHETGDHMDNFDLEAGKSGDERGSEHDDAANAGGE